MNARRISHVQLRPWDAPSLLHRSTELRDDDTLQLLWRSPQARLLQVDAASQFALNPFGMPAAGELDETIAFLGTVHGGPWFAQRVEQIPGGETIRDASLTDTQYQLASAALAILNWGESALFCDRCAGRLRRIRGGFAAVCTICGREHFPRTDPAVIVAVLDPDDRLFLAHQGSWAAGRASILAGFVEAGESAENAVHREVAEEARLLVDSCRFIGSQPWPFPRSLMLAYVARTRSTGRVDKVELEWGGWYTRADVDAAQARGSLTLPGAGSVAGRILDAWRAGALPSPD